MPRPTFSILPQMFLFSEQPCHTGKVFRSIDEEKHSEKIG